MNMIESIPKGKLIGTMQAPLSWIFSHTTRFLGVARITIQDGDGIILIEKGRPRFFYYRQGSRVLKGHAAEDYFSSQPVIHFGLFKLTAEEFTLALSIADPDTVPKPTHAEPHPGTPQDKPSQTMVLREFPKEGKPHITEKPPEGIPSLIKDEKEGEAAVGSRDLPPRREDPVAKTTRGKTAAEPVTTGQVHAPPDLAVSSGTQDLFAGDEEKTLAAGATLPQPQRDKSAFQTMPRPAPVQQAAEEHIPDVDLRTIAQILLGRIKTIPGVVAVLVFNKDMNIISIGDINLDTLVSSAEDMLMTVSQLDSIMEWGSFVQMTIQVPSGNVIIAPFFNEYLCILTTPEINLGRIRRILKEIKLQQNR